MCYGVDASKMMDWGIRRKCNNNVCGWLLVVAVELVLKTGHVIFNRALAIS